MFAWWADRKATNGWDRTKSRRAAPAPIAGIAGATSAPAMYRQPTRGRFERDKATSDGSAAARDIATDAIDDHLCSPSHLIMTTRGRAEPKVPIRSAERDFARVSDVDAQSLDELPLAPSGSRRDLRP
jgi:hypothetical protein